jgi:hypothetical protein
MNFLHLKIHDLATPWAGLAPEVKRSHSGRIGAEALNELLSDFIALPIGGPMAINPR